LSIPVQFRNSHVNAVGQILPALIGVAVHIAPVLPFVPFVPLVIFGKQCFAASPGTDTKHLPGIDGARKFVAGSLKFAFSDNGFGIPVFRDTETIYALAPGIEGRRRGVDLEIQAAGYIQGG
jgi:hypothetical protein